MIRHTWITKGDEKKKKTNRSETLAKTAGRDNSLILCKDGRTVLLLREEGAQIASMQTKFKAKEQMGNQQNPRIITSPEPGDK
jgi:hypothetical protein